MASLLLDENVSPVVADQILQKDPGARIVSIHRWRNGELLSAEDEIILQVAYEEKLTLMTFDPSTIKLLLKMWAEDGRSHGGVIFIDDKSIASNNHGMLVRAVLQEWERLKDTDFTDGVRFLKRVG